MCTVFWNKKGVLLWIILPDTVNSTTYSETLNKLRVQSQAKSVACWVGRSFCSMTMLVHSQLNELKISSHHLGGKDFITHTPPYSPDLAPNDYHVFLHLKKHRVVFAPVTMIKSKRPCCSGCRVILWRGRIKKLLFDATSALILAKLM